MFTSNRFRRRIGRLDLQAKIVLVLIAVIVPTFALVTLLENQLTEPLLSEELRQLGITTGKGMASDILSMKLLSSPEPSAAIESRIQEVLYYQPNILRLEVLSKDPTTGLGRVIASNVEDDPTVTPQVFVIPESVTSEFKPDEQGVEAWDIYVPIEMRGRDGKLTHPHKVLGAVHVVISLKFMKRILSTLWKVTGTAAVISVMTLVFALSYFLRKTINNDRALRKAENVNLQLTERLHEAQRQVMNSEKLAVMGQLTASFAHEIGTPLNAIGGHLQLLQEEIEPKAQGEVRNRLEIIGSQLRRIEQIVKNFLQSTAKPPTQRQLVDFNRIIDQTLSLVSPRTEALGIRVNTELDRSLAPLRMVPLELEQVLLNLINNSIDSLKSKGEQNPGSALQLDVESREDQIDGKRWVVLSVYDTGQGISREHLTKVRQPFFTTKRPGEGTGLGLTISEELARRHGGMLQIESKEGSWTRVSLRLPDPTGTA